MDDCKFQYNQEALVYLKKTLIRALSASNKANWVLQLGWILSTYNAAT